MTDLNSTNPNNTNTSPNIDENQNANPDHFRDEQERARRSSQGQGLTLHQDKLGENDDRQRVRRKPIYKDQSDDKVRAFRNKKKKCRSETRSYSMIEPKTNPASHTSFHYLPRQQDAQNASSVTSQSLVPSSKGSVTSVQGGAAISRTRGERDSTNTPRNADLLMELKAESSKLTEFLKPRTIPITTIEEENDQEDEKEMGAYSNPYFKKQEGTRPIPHSILQKENQFPLFKMMSSGHRGQEEEEKGRYHHAKKGILWLFQTLPVLRDFQSANKIFQILRQEYDKLGANNSFLNLAYSLLEMIQSSNDRKLWRSFVSMIQKETRKNPDVVIYIKYLLAREDGASFHITRIANHVYDSLPSFAPPTTMRTLNYLTLFRLQNCKRQLAKCLILFFQRMVSTRFWSNTMSYKYDIFTATTDSTNPNQRQQTRPAQNTNTRVSRNIYTTPTLHDLIQQEQNLLSNSTSKVTPSQLTTSSLSDRESRIAQTPSHLTGDPKRPLNPEIEEDFWWNHYVYITEEIYPQPTTEDIFLSSPQPRENNQGEDPKSLQGGGGQDIQKTEGQIEDTEKPTEGPKDQQMQEENQNQKEDLLGKQPEEQAKEGQESLEEEENEEEEEEEKTKEGQDRIEEEEKTKEGQEGAQGDQQTQEAGLGGQEGSPQDTSNIQQPMDTSNIPKPTSPPGGNNTTTNTTTGANPAATGGEGNHTDLTSGNQTKTTAGGIEKKGEKEQEQEDEDWDHKEVEEEIEYEEEEEEEKFYLLESRASKIVPFKIIQTPTEMMNLERKEQDLHVVNLLQEFCQQKEVTDKECFGDEKPIPISYLDYCAALGQIRTMRGINQIQYLHPHTGEIISQSAATFDPYSLTNNQTHTDDTMLTENKEQGGRGKEKEDISRRGTVLRSMSVELVLGPSSQMSARDTQEKESFINLFKSNTREEATVPTTTTPGTHPSPSVKANVLYHLVDDTLRPCVLLRETNILELMGCSNNDSSFSSHRNKLTTRLDLINEIEKSEAPVSACLVNQFFDNNGFLFCQPTLNMKNIQKDQQWKLEFTWEALEGSQNLIACYILSAYLHSMVHKNYTMLYSNLIRDSNSGNVVVKQLLKNLREAGHVEE